MTSKTFDICGVGNALVDVMAECDDAFLESNQITKGSMKLVDRTHALSLYDRIKPVAEMSGGSIANTVVGVASFGGNPTYIGKVRKDKIGDIFSKDMKSTGADFRTSPSTDGEPTGLCISLVTPDAQRSMCTFLGAAKELNVDDINPEIIQASKITYFEGFLLDNPPCHDAFLKAAKIAKAVGRKMALNLSDKFCVERHRADFYFFAKNHSDILVANEHEIMALYGESNLDAALAQAKEDCEIIVATRGEKGSIIISGDKSIKMDAAPVAKLLDTTGAGDMFAAGFLYGITHGRDIGEAGKFGALAAAEIISQYGSRPQTPLKKFL